MNKITKILKSAFLVIVLSGCQSAVLANSKSSESFSVLFFSEVELSEVETYQADTSALSKADKEKLLSAKSAFSSFLKKLQNADDDAVDALGKNLRDKYGDRVKLFKYLFGDAESLVSYEIMDFKINGDSKRVSFRYFVTEMAEGTTCTHQQSVTLKMKADNSWEIYDFIF